MPAKLLSDVVKFSIVFLLNRLYTLVQTNVSNKKKTAIEIIQSQAKSKISLPYYVHVMRDKIQERKA